MLPSQHHASRRMILGLLLLAFTGTIVLVILRDPTIPSTHLQPPDGTAHRQLLHQVNGPPRGRQLESGQPSRKFHFWPLQIRSWRRFYVVVPYLSNQPSGNTTTTTTERNWCQCSLECARTVSTPLSVISTTRDTTVNLYMTDYEGYWIHEYWDWDNEAPYGCVGATDGTVTESCAILSLRRRQWYCYAAVHHVRGLALGCQLNCTVTPHPDV